MDKQIVHLNRTQQLHDRLSFTRMPIHEFGITDQRVSALVWPGERPCDDQHQAEERVRNQFEGLLLDAQLYTGPTGQGSAGDAAVCAYSFWALLLVQQSPRFLR